MMGTTPGGPKDNEENKSKEDEDLEKLKCKYNINNIYRNK